MGGFGSGRRSGSGRGTVESCLALDVNELSRRGCLDAGWIGRWRWFRDDQDIASIGLRAEQARLHLAYRVRIGRGGWEDVTETVDIVRVPCNLGGRRAYFICPGVVNGIACGRRVVRLHGPGRYFLCRHCCRLGYASQGEGGWDRARRRSEKLRQRLGGDRCSSSLVLPRPKGMWRRTHARLSGQVLQAERQADETFVRDATRLIERIERARRKRRSRG